VAFESEGYLRRILIVLVLLCVGVYLLTFLRPKVQTSTEPQVEAPSATARINNTETGAPDKSQASLAGKKEASHSELSDKQISRVIQAQMTALTKCHNQLARKNPDVQVTATISMSIKPDGSVGHSQVLRSPDKAFEECILGIVRKLRFEAFNGDAINIKYPINFE
jgi:TonB family protein